MAMDKLETILTLMRLPSVGPARIRRALAVLGEAQMPIEEAFSESGRRLLTATGVSPSAPQAAIGHVAEQLRREGVHCLVAPFCELALSEMARRNLPPVIFASGPADLMAAASVGFCGSRSATERGLAVAADIAEQVARQGLNVVSGGAKGVDITAHKTALSHGGTTTVVLAEGILQYRMRHELRDVFDPARTLLVSEFFPEDLWIAGRAMQRNRTICALSRALVLIEARATGGTFAAGEAALAMRLPPSSPPTTARNLKATTATASSSPVAPFACSRVAPREGRTLRNCSQWRAARARGNASARERLLMSDSRICFQGDCRSSGYLR
jgi:predicted Rossmann fold nucleotide-binding protein DprA/Smf involved in DNA uptake